MTKKERERLIEDVGHAVREVSSALRLDNRTVFADSIVAQWNFSDRSGHQEGVLRFMDGFLAGVKASRIEVKNGWTVSK